jgi:octaprenyl-diphosphate synthase
MDLGIAFQIVDDTLDYTGKNIGKNVGDDLEEGKPTLPLIRAMQTAAPEKAAVVRDAIENGGRDRIEEIMQIIRETDAIDYSMALAHKHADAATRALEILPASAYRDALAELADFAVNRDY